MEDLRHSLLSAGEDRVARRPNPSSATSPELSDFATPQNLCHSPARSRSGQPGPGGPVSALRGGGDVGTMNWRTVPPSAVIASGFAAVRTEPVQSQVAAGRTPTLASLLRSQDPPRRREP